MARPLIISPDNYLYTDDGEYVWTPESARESWDRTYSEVSRALAKPEYRKLVLLVGIPASGKSTWLKSHAENGTVYIDATFARPYFRKPYIQLAHTLGKEVWAVVSTTPIHTCLSRNECRTPDRKVPVEKILEMSVDIANEPPSYAEGFTKVVKVMQKQARLEGMSDADLNDLILGLSAYASKLLGYKSKTIWQTLVAGTYNFLDEISYRREIPASKMRAYQTLYKMVNGNKRFPKDFHKWAEEYFRLMSQIGDWGRWPAKTEENAVKVGPFTVHNLAGMSEDKFSQFLTIIEIAWKKAKAIKIPGFQRALYGHITLTGNVAPAHHLAWYNIKDDTVYVITSKRGRSPKDFAQSIIHELGHRYLWKFADKEKTKLWKQYHYRVDGGFDVKVAMPNVGEEVDVFKVKGTKKPLVITKLEGPSYTAEDEFGEQYRISVRNMYDALQRKVKLTQAFPTPYSSVSPEEHFCESVKLLAFTDLGGNFLTKFVEIWF